MQTVLKLPAAMLLPGMVAAAVLAGPARADVVTDWNVTANDIMTAANTGNNPRLRSLAMMHVAMSDAINTVDGRYMRVIATMPPVPGASAEAAAAAAARHILLELYPKQKTKIDDAYTASLKAIPDGAARSDGIALGEQVAAAVVADCASDGTNAADTYRPLTSPGVYVPTMNPVFPEYAKARPWLLNKADHFRPSPPPTLSSATWARDYNEVKSMGGVKSTMRTPEQTEAVKFWGNTNFGPSWQAAARHLSAAKELGLADTARVFALLNMSLANNYVLNWDAKYHYNFWRPVTAIRNGDIDGNDATERDPGWTPLNMTPMHPEYPSQATMNATVAAAVLQSVFGPVAAIPLTVTDVADAKKTRHFASIADMVEEQKNVRIWGGVHYRSAIDTGAEMGRQLSAYMIDNALKPAP
jgi:hypothetical protein